MLYEVVKAKPGLYWRPQEAGDGRVVGVSTTTCEESHIQGWNQLKGEKCVAVSNAGRMEPSKPCDIRHGVPEFGICPVGFQSSFGHSIPSLCPCYSFSGMLT